MVKVSMLQIKKTDIVIQYLVQALLLVYCFIYELVPAVIIGILVLLLGIYLCTTKRKFPLDFAILFLAEGLFLAIYYGFHFLGNVATVDVNKNLLPIAAYIFGIFVVVIGDNDYVKRVMITMACGMFCYGGVGAVKSIRGGIVGTFNGIRLENNDFLGINQVQVLFFFTTALLCYAALKFKEQKVLSVIIIAMNMVAQALCIGINGKYNTYFLVLELLLLLFIALQYLFTKQFKSKRMGVSIAIVCVMILVTFIVVIFDQNIFGLKDKYYSSFWGIDGGLLHSYKYYNFKEACMKFVANPRKGFFIEANGINTSFNMWMDYARDYGIYTFALLIIFKLMTIIYAIRLLFNKTIDSGIKYMLIPVFVAFNIFYSFESIAKTENYMWCWGLIVCGMISAIIRRNNNCT